MKSWEMSESFDLRLSSGAATLVPDFNRLYGLAGITASFKDRYATFANYDGNSFHEGFAWIPLDWLTVSFLMIETEYPAFSIAIGR
jgi:hypothetical protein